MTPSVPEVSLGVGVVVTVTAGIQAETLRQGTATHLWADVGLGSFVHLMAIHIFEPQCWINYLKTVFLSCMNDPWLRCLPLCNVLARISSNKVTTWVGCCQTFFFCLPYSSPSVCSESVSWHLVSPTIQQFSECSSVSWPTPTYPTQTVYSSQASAGTSLAHYSKVLGRGRKQRF